MEKNEIKNKKTGADLGLVAIGVGFIAVGTMTIIKGLNAYQTGAIITFPGKSGPMSGSHAAIVGFLFFLFGTGFLINELMKARKRKQQNKV